VRAMLTAIRVLGVLGLLFGVHSMVFASAEECGLELNPVFHTFSCVETDCSPHAGECHVVPVTIDELPEPEKAWGLCTCLGPGSTGTCQPVGRMNWVWDEKKEVWVLVAQLACFNDGCLNPAPCGGPLSSTPPVCPGCP